MSVISPNSVIQWVAFQWHRSKWLVEQLCFDYETEKTVKRIELYLTMIPWAHVINHRHILTTKVRRHKVLVGERGSRADAKSQTLILLRQTHTHTHTHTLCTVLNTNDDNQKKIALKLCGQQAPAAWSYRPSKCLLLEAVPFRLLQLKFGTVCQRPSSHRHHCSLSGVNWRLIFFKYRIHTWFSDCLWYRYSGPCSNVVI